MQSGKPAASGGRVELLDELLPVELELVPLMVLLLPVVVLGVSLRTCFVTLSQHFAVPVAALGEVVVVENVWAAAIPILPTSIAAAITPIPVIRMRRVLPYCGVVRRGVAVTYSEQERPRPVPSGRVTKKDPRGGSSAVMASLAYGQPASGRGERGDQASAARDPVLLCASAMIPPSQIEDAADAGR